MAYRGIEGREEIRKSRRTRDVRNFGQKWRDFLPITLRQYCS